jgi:hypothetical protein
MENNRKKEYSKEYYEKNKDKIKKKATLWNKNHPENIKRYRDKPSMKEYQKLYRKKYQKGKTTLWITKDTQIRLKEFIGYLMLGMSYDESINYMLDIVYNLNRKEPTIQPLFTQQEWEDNWKDFKQDEVCDEDYQSYINRKNNK